MAHLPFLGRPGGPNSLASSKKTLVDLRPWQTAQALAALAVTAEEMEYAHEAERLADHEVDQAFASALRQAEGQAMHRVLTGDALALSQRVAELQQTVKEDQTLVQSLTPASSPGSAPANKVADPQVGDDDLEVAKAQLGLDSDELADAQQDLDRASGDDRAQIQSELTAHEAAMRKFDSPTNGGDGQVAVLSAGSHGTLAGRVKVWFSQRERYQLIQQAIAQTEADALSLTAEHDALQAKANAKAAAGPSAAPDLAARLTNIKARRAERQLLSIFDDRIQTQQQLAKTYEKWSTQVRLQHRIVMHLILQSMALVLLILVCMVLGDALVRRLMAHPVLERKQMLTLRSILELAIQVVGGLIILFIVFGTPQQISAILGLVTAGLTIALQDFIVAFLGWFALMGKNGIRVGDWVEINGVGGEVTEIGLFSTTLMETGNLEEKGHPTGRRITFMNSFAIRGQYFNFSTAGQWTWDEITISLPASDDPQTKLNLIQQAVLDETKGNVSIAEQEWKRTNRGDALSRFSAAPVVSLRPSASGMEIQARYITRASTRFEVRNRLYQHVVELLGSTQSPPDSLAQGEQADAGSNSIAGKS
jgi:small-conductance mechanosensitive channel